MPPLARQVRWTILALLLSVTIINFVDRQSLSIVAPLLRESLVSQWFLVRERAFAVFEADAGLANRFEAARAHFDAVDARGEKGQRVEALGIRAGLPGGAGTGICHRDGGLRDRRPAGIGDDAG